MQKSKKSFAKIILAIMVIFALAIPASTFAYANSDVAAIAETDASLAIDEGDVEALKAAVDKAAEEGTKDTLMSTEEPTEVAADVEAEVSDASAEDTLVEGETAEDGAAEDAAAEAPEEESADATGATGETAFSVDIDGEATDYDLSDGESAAAYVDGYADNQTTPASKNILKQHSARYVKKSALMQHYFHFSLR